MFDHKQQNEIDVIHDTLNNLESLWMKLSSMSFDPDNNQFLSLSNQLKAQINSLSPHHLEKNTALTQKTSEIDQIFNTVTTSGDVMPHRKSMTTALRRIRQAVLELENISNNLSEKVAESKKIKLQEVIVVSVLGEKVAVHLKKSGFATRCVDTVEKMAAILSNGIPRAILIDLQFQLDDNSPLSLSEVLNDTVSPVIYLLGDDTIPNRICAAQAGGVGYFPFPIHIPLLISKLHSGLKKKPMIPAMRIMMVDDAASATSLLESGLKVKAVSRAEDILACIDSYKPQLIVLNMAFPEIDGFALYQALRQHPKVEKLPVILLANEETINNHLHDLDRQNLDVITHPLSPEFLTWYIQQRLYQLNTVRNQIHQIDKQDKLTGLLNRHYFLLTMKELLHSTTTPFKHSAVVMLIMIDNMNDIRTKTDAARSDEIIMIAAQAFKKSAKPFAKKLLLQARFTDNIFAVLCINVDESVLKTCAVNVIEAMESAGQTGEARKENIEVKVCVGVSAVETSPPKDYLALIQQAKAACTRAEKKEGKRVHILSSESGLNKAADVPAEMIEKIHYAIENGLLKLFFQPIVGFAKDQHKRYEVYLRLYEKDGSEMSSGSLFSAIEEHALNYELDRWVIEQTMRILAKNREATSTTSLFINLSARTLQEDDFFDWFKEKHIEYNIEPFRFVFEISEKMLKDYHEIVYDVMEHFKHSGSYVSLQRYSGGLKAQALLKEFGFNYVKVTNDWFAEILDDKKAQLSLKNLIARLNQQKITMIASEIEDMQLLPLICSSNIQYVQGNFMQQPETVMNYDFSHSIF